MQRRDVERICEAAGLRVSDASSDIICASTDDGLGVVLLLEEDCWHGYWVPSNTLIRLTGSEHILSRTLARDLDKLKKYHGRNSAA